jgi:hypothetical protein
MRTKLLLAAIVAGGALAGLQGSANAQGASAYPQTLSPYDYSQVAPGWDHYGAQDASRYYNEVPTQQLNTVRNRHRAERTSGER